MTAVRGPHEEAVDAVNASTHVHGRDQRRIDTAVRTVARREAGFVDPNMVRAELTNEHGLVVNPRVLSARYRKLLHRGVITPAGTTTNLDIAGGNHGKPMRLYEVTDEAWLNVEDGDGQ